MDAFKSGRDSAIKSAISTSTDTYRPPYGRVTTAFPRQCVFIGTTDQKDFLKDTAGNRRYWPITVSEIRIDLLEQNRDQYWAEALHRFRQGESFHEMPESAFEMQESFRKVDPWEGVIQQYLRGKFPIERYPIDSACPPESVTTTEILKYAIDMPVERMNRSAEMRVGSILKLMGWESRRVRCSDENMKTERLERRYFPEK